MLFEVIAYSGERTGALIYRAEEYSFAYEPTAVGAFTSVLVNDVSLEIDEDGVILEIWGLCPYMSWIDATLDVPKAFLGNVRVISNTPFQRGISKRSGPKRHQIFADPLAGWG